MRFQPKPELSKELTTLIRNEFSLHLWLQTRIFACEIKAFKHATSSDCVGNMSQSGTTTKLKNSLDCNTLLQFGDCLDPYNKIFVAL
jgi:hypothetical protein